MESSWAVDGWCISEYTVRKVRADYQLEVLYTAPASTAGAPNRVFAEELWKEATNRWKPCAISISPARPNQAKVTWWKRPETPPSATSTVRQLAASEAHVLSMPPPFFISATSTASLMEAAGLMEAAVMATAAQHAQAAIRASATAITIAADQGAPAGAQDDPDCEGIIEPRVTRRRLQ